MICHVNLVLVIPTCERHLAMRDQQALAHIRCVLDEGAYVVYHAAK